MVVSFVINSIFIVTTYGESTNQIVFSNAIPIPNLKQERSVHVTVAKFVHFDRFFGPFRVQGVLNDLTKRRAKVRKNSSVLYQDLTSYEREWGLCYRDEAFEWYSKDLIGEHTLDGSSLRIAQRMYSPDFPFKSFASKFRALHMNLGKHVIKRGII
jgi:hypothetical protein